MIFQIILTLILANYSFGDDFDQRPKTPEKLLEWMMAEPGPNARKVSKNRDENFVGTSKERMRWFRQLGLPLKPKDIEAMKKIISNSKCQYTGEYKDKRATKVTSPPCTNSFGPTVSQCGGQVQCQFPAFTYYITAICITNSTGNCPMRKPVPYNHPLI